MTLNSSGQISLAGTTTGQSNVYSPIINTLIGDLDGHHNQ